MPTTSDEQTLFRHELPWGDFSLLARAQDGPVTVGKLRAAERSRRLLLLRALADDAAGPESSGPLPSPEAAWNLLVRTQEAAPEALELILAHPYTGSWAGYSTRMVHQKMDSPGPAWFHLGYLNAVAAAAAIHAELEFSIRIPMWAGSAVLPTLGLAFFPGAAEFDSAEVRRTGEGVEIIHSDEIVRVPTNPRDDAPGWSGLRRLTFRSAERNLELSIDDLDPYRGLFGPRAPERLSDQDLATWRTMIDQAWQLIAGHLPEFADALSAGMDSIVPDPPFPFRLPSASTGEAFGSAVICRPDDPAQLAAALVHEFQHIRLGALLQLIPLHSDDRSERLYAPWRDDPRPIGGVLHGVYAFYGVTMFWRAFSAGHPDDELASFEYAHWRGQVWRTLKVIRDDANLTEDGRSFLDEIASRLAQWQLEPVPDQSAAWAGTLAADHYAGWRLRHVRPPAATVAGLVDAWRAGLACPPVDDSGDLATDSDGEWEEARADLVRVRLGVNGAERLAEVWSQVPKALPGDYALVEGRVRAAAEEYRATLTADPDSPGALIGLGLALRSGDEPAARALLQRPELVRAVHREIRSGSTARPEDLAGWLAGGLT